MRARTTALLALLVCLAVGSLSAIAADGANEAWSYSRLLSGYSVLGGDGNGSLVSASWYRQVAGNGSVDYGMQVTTSHDDGQWFDDGPWAPYRDTRPLRVTGVAVEGTSAYIASQLTDADDRLAVRIDHVDSDGWSAPVELSGQQCGYQYDATAIIAVHGPLVLVVDSCGTLWRSADGGASFSERRLPDSAYMGPAEPQALTWNGAGFSLLLHWGYETDHLASWTSADGATWSAATDLPLTGQYISAKTRVARDAATGTLMAATSVNTNRGQGELARLRVEIRTSTDGGQTWSEPVVRHEGPANSDGYFASPPLLAATPQGFDLTTMAYDGGEPHWVRWRFDGQSWSDLPPPPPISPTNNTFMLTSVSGGARVHLMRNGFYDRSVDRGDENTPIGVTPEAPPSLTITPSVISAGQRVTVTYRGRPGTVLTILSKTQPATSYSVIGTVQLDPRGIGTSSHAPMRNTRLMARSAGGRDGLQPLIQVRSVASLNAARVTSGTYRFTGRVYPARTGRLVSLYGNGRLFGQARTDSSGVYTITKASVRGRFDFYVRTANDTYNLGATSRAVAVSIS